MQKQDNIPSLTAPVSGLRYVDIEQFLRSMAAQDPIPAREPGTSVVARRRRTSVVATADGDDERDEDYMPAMPAPPLPPTQTVIIAPANSATTASTSATTVTTVAPPETPKGKKSRKQPKSKDKLRLPPSTNLSMVKPAAMPHQIAEPLRVLAPLRDLVIVPNRVILPYAARMVLTLSASAMSISYTAFHDMSTSYIFVKPGSYEFFSSNTVYDLSVARIAQRPTKAAFLKAYGSEVLPWMFRSLTAWANHCYADLKLHEYATSNALKYADIVAAIPCRGADEPSEGWGILPGKAGGEMSEKYELPSKKDGQVRTFSIGRMSGKAKKVQIYTISDSISMTYAAFEARLKTVARDAHIDVFVARGTTNRGTLRLSQLNDSTMALDSDSDDEATDTEQEKDDDNDDDDNASSRTKSKKQKRTASKRKRAASSDDERTSAPKRKSPSPSRTRSTKRNKKTVTFSLPAGTETADDDDPSRDNAGAGESYGVNTLSSLMLPPPPKMSMAQKTPRKLDANSLFDQLRPSNVVAAAGASAHANASTSDGGSLVVVSMHNVMVPLGTLSDTAKRVLIDGVQHNKWISVHLRKLVERHPLLVDEARASFVGNRPQFISLRNQFDDNDFALMLRHVTDDGERAQMGIVNGVRRAWEQLCVHGVIPTGAPLIRPNEWAADDERRYDKNSRALRRVLQRIVMPDGNVLIQWGVQATRDISVDTTIGLYDGYLLKGGFAELVAEQLVYQLAGYKIDEAEDAYAVAFIDELDKASVCVSARDVKYHNNSIIAYINCCPIDRLDMVNCRFKENDRVVTTTKFVRAGEMLCIDYGVQYHEKMRRRGVVAGVPGDSAEQLPLVRPPPLVYVTDRQNNSTSSQKRQVDEDDDVDDKCADTRSRISMASLVDIACLADTAEADDYNGDEPRANEAYTTSSPPMSQRAFNHRDPSSPTSSQRSFTFGMGASQASQTSVLLDRSPPSSQRDIGRHLPLPSFAELHVPKNTNKTAHRAKTTGKRNRIVDMFSDDDNDVPSSSLRLARSAKSASGAFRSGDSSTINLYGADATDLSAFFAN